METSKLKIIEVILIKTNHTKVLARADVQFDGFILKGFKILQDDKTKKEYVTPPSYQSPHGWRPLFKTDSVEDWQKIQQYILNKFTAMQIDDTLSDENENF